MRYLLIIISVFVFYKVACTGSKDNNNIRNNLVSFAEEHLGKSYDPRNKKGFDCSGFVQYCYSEFDYKLPRSSKAQFKFGSKVKREEAEIGDIIVFTGTNAKKRVAGHVGIIHHFQNDTLYFIHASFTQGIMINKLSQVYYEKRFLGIRGVFN